MHLEIEIVGNIGNDAVLKEMNGRKVLNFSIAHSERYKKQDGTMVENTTWLNCSYWDAEKIAPYLKKGTMVMVKGKPAVSVYQNKAGQHVADLRCQVAVLRLLSKKPDEARAGTSQPATGSQAPPPPPVNNFPDMPPGTADDLPF